VRVQADAKFRTDPMMLRRIEVRNRDGDRVPLANAVGTGEPPRGTIDHPLQSLPRASIQGAAGPGVSSGEALAAMHETARTVLPQSMGYEWTRIAFQEQRVTGEAVMV